MTVLLIKCKTKDVTKIIIYRGSRKGEYKTLINLFKNCKDMNEAHKLSSIVFGVVGSKHIACDIERKTENINSGIYDEEATKITVKPSNRYREKTASRVDVKGKTQVKKAMAREVLEKRKREKAIIESRIVNNKLVFKDLVNISEEERRVFLSWLSSIFESALKCNEYLEFAIMTGCLRISKESIFIGLNNLNIISILNTHYDEYFGFTENEVSKMLKYYRFEDKENIIKKWYNGYLFGECNVYNPWSVNKFIYDLTGNRNTLPISYWANTSSNSIVMSLIEKADDDTKAQIEELIAGKTIEKVIHEDITYADIDSSMENLWNFLFFTGYVKKVFLLQLHILDRYYIWI